MMTRPVGKSEPTVFWLVARFGEKSQSPRHETGAMSFSGVREERLKTPLPNSPPALADASSPAKSVLRSPQCEAPHALDAQFSALVHDIQQRLALLARAPTIRVEKWLRKLHDPVSNVMWKKLRNDYARLLRHNLRQGATSPPFDRAPGDGPLRNLLPAERARFRGDGFATNGRRAGGERERAVAETKQHARTKNGAKTTSNDAWATDDGDSAEAALRDLLRRAEVAGAPASHPGAANAGAVVPRPLQGLFEDERTNPFLDADDVRSNERAALSREMRAFIAAEGVDAKASSFADVDAPRAADAVAALGAEREKCKELEWRLRRAETALESCRAELRETRLAANAMREVKAEEVREIRASHKRELDRLVAGFERRRAEVRAPRAAASLRVAGASEGFPLPATRPPLMMKRPSAFENARVFDAEGGASRLRVPERERTESSAAEKERDFFAYLEAFQRGTSELRRRAATSDGAE